MKRFCSLTYDIASRMLASRLRFIIDPKISSLPSTSSILGSIDDVREAITRAKVTIEEAKLVLTALEDQSGWDAPFDAVTPRPDTSNTDTKSKPSTPSSPRARVALLRELCADGYLGTHVAEFKSWDSRHKR
jgi:hypothetical protein